VFRPISIAFVAIALVASVSAILGISGASSLRRDSTIFGRITPSIADSGDRNAVELGLKFRPLVNGWVTGIRFYKAVRNTGTHVAGLWTTDGHVLASATFRGESRSGWQSVAFVRPVRVRRGATYVAGYFAPAGHYAISKHVLRSAITHGRLEAISSSPSGSGVYTYASHSTFPSSTYAATSFYVDVDFTPSSGRASPPTGAQTTPTPVSLLKGVTEQPIDGGPNYYCSNGFTYACRAGWDNPSFFPIMDNFAFYPSNRTSAFKSMGFNTTESVTGGTGGATTCASGATDLSVLKAAGIWADLGGDSGCNVGTETVMAHIEEPCGWSGSCAGMGPITSQASTLNSMFNITGRPLEAIFTWEEFANPGMRGDPCGSTTMQAAMTCTSGMPEGRHLDIPTADIYWFAGDPPAANYSENYCGSLYNGGGANCTLAQADEASHYGDMVDAMRRWVNGDSATGAPGTAPTAPYIEADDGMVTSGRPIKPNELNWAAWDTIIHGARMLIWFGATENTSTFGFSPTPQSGFTISDATQATHTNKLVENLAPLINSPFADGYVSSSDGGYTFPTPDRMIGSGSQMDVMAKYYSGNGLSNSSGRFGPGFYIFATPRGTETGTNIAVTFTIKGNYSGSVPYICACSPTQSSGTVSVSHHQFSDTFVKASDVHIYGPFPNQ
jgi:hypothetical protein